ncbi:MAG: BACON domain-containing protein [Bacteroides sp.]|nr:BACON domain-containing protein [Bacteroides sp.]
MKSGLSAILFLLLLVCSCTSDDEKVSTPELKITSSDADVPIASDGGEVYIEFSANCSWKASADQSWCRVSRSSGEAGEYTLTVTADTNADYDDRNAVVSIVYGTTSEDITITQKQKDAIILSSNKKEVTSDGGGIEIELESNVEFDYEIVDDASEWITPQPATRGLSTSVLRFAVAENTMEDRREGYIVIKSEDLEETVTVYQEGLVPSIVLTQKEYTVSAEGETIKVELQSNVKYEVRMPDENWVTESTTRAMSTYTHYFVIAANEDYDSRETSIGFVNTDTGTESWIQIVQVQKDAIIVAQSEYELDHNAQQLSFDVSANVSLTVESSVDWIRQAVNTRKLTTTELSFTIDENTGTEPREGVITVSNGEIRQEIKIVQTAYVYITTPQDTYYVEFLGNTVAIEVSSNVDYEVKMPGDDWISYGGVDGQNPNIHYFVVEPRAYYISLLDSRKAEIQFVNSNYQLETTVDIVQLSADILVNASSEGYTVADGVNLVSHGLCGDTLYVGYKKDILIERSYSLDLEPQVDNKPDWISVSTDHSSNIISISTIEENPNEYSRSAIISLSESTYGYKQKICVIQAARPIQVGNYYAMDLGLNVKWAIHNVGASSTEDTGGLYGWGDPTGQETTNDVYNKDGHWVSELYGGPNPPASICGTSLDIATSQWGNNWRMPSYAESQELWFNSDVEWVTYNGVEGISFTSWNGNSVFLPGAGYRSGTNVFLTPLGYLSAYYWTGTYADADSAYRFNCDAMWAEYHAFADNGMISYRYIGHSVRPVVE